MQMRTGDASRASAECDLLALLHIVAFFNQEFRQVQIERKQALAMVDDHTIPFKEQRPRENDTSAVCCCDRGSSGHAEIEALMRALHGTIEDALDSEHFGDRGIHRRPDRPPPSSSPP